MMSCAYVLLTTLLCGLIVINSGASWHSPRDKREDSNTCPPDANCINDTCSAHGCVDGCSSDTVHGPFCNETCSKWCKEGRCEQETGKCKECNDERLHGDTCNVSCPVGCCSRPNCDSDQYGYCDQNGTCIRGCHDRFTGDFCREECPRNCKDGQCDQRTKACLHGCVSIRYGGEQCGEDRLVVYVTVTILVLCLVAFIVVLVISIRYGTHTLLYAKCTNAKRKGKDDDPAVSESLLNVHPHFGPVEAIPLQEKEPIKIEDDGVHAPVVDGSVASQRLLDDSDRPGTSQDHTAVADKTDSPYMQTLELALNALDGHTKMLVAELNDWEGADDEPVCKEYQKIRNEKRYPWIVANHSDFKYKNRFKDMPYDKNRVKLTVQNGNPKTDDIDARYIQGYYKNETFIASHGPSEHTVRDFVRMLWEQEVKIIVMVTNLVENNKAKGIQYWANAGEVRNHRDFTMTTEDEKSWPDFNTRTLKLSKKGEETREISHLQYIGWPDQGAPLHPGAMMKLRRHVRQAMENSPGIVLVHCSAGVECTYTYIAYDYLLEQAKNKHVVDVVRCVDELREQRHQMVQSQEQYVFLYRALNETLTVGDTVCPAHEFVDTYERWKRYGQLHKQFQFLCGDKTTFFDDEFDVARREKNRGKNRDMSVIPAERHRVVVGKDSSRYFNAVEVQGYKEHIGYIATQVPLQASLLDFWQFVFDEKIACLVCVEDVEDTHWFPFQQDDSIQCGEYTIHLLNSCEKSDGIWVLTLRIHKGSVDTKAYVIQSFDYKKESPANTWTTQMVSTPGWCAEPLHNRDRCTLYVVHDIVMKCQRKSHPGPTLCVCRNGAQECGVYIACSYVITMVTEEQEVDIFQVAKIIGTKRPQFISDYEQYEFLHEVVKRYMDEFTDYSNFRSSGQPATRGPAVQNKSSRI